MKATRPLVLYHAGCFDGFCAAWSAWQRFKGGADYLPVSYGQEPPDVAGRNLFILDFCYKRPAMDRLRLSALTLTVIDHHKTAQADLDGFGAAGPNEETNVRCVFDLNKSGGRLSWEFFCRDRPAPWLVAYTEDRDLWRHALPNTREINAAIRSYPFDFDLWDSWGFDSEMNSNLFNQFLGAGAAILRYQQQLIDSACEHAAEIDMDGHKVLSVNVTTLMSEVGERLSEGRPFSATFFIRKDGKKVWSLRSRGGTGIDVSEIAKRHGGGGHKNAAGFEE